MPEGHTIHRLAERHRSLFAGRIVTASSPQGRFTAGAARISGRVLVDTSAHGKHLFHHYAGDVALHVHLGLYGRFSDGDVPAPPPVGEVRLRLVGAHHWLDLRGPAACELLDPAQLERLRGRLGPDPLDPHSSGELAYGAISRSARPIMTLLMDQSVVAGAGLIYVTEALFRAGLPMRSSRGSHARSPAPAGIPPTLPGRQLSPEAWQGIWHDLRMLMRTGVIEGRIDTVHSVHTPEAMGRAPRVDRHGGEVYVYRRTGQPCLVCGSPVRTAVLNGRNAYWCDVCQPAPRATHR